MNYGNNNLVNFTACKFRCLMWLYDDVVVVVVRGIRSGMHAVSVRATQSAFFLHAGEKSQQRVWQLCGQIQYQQYI